MFKGFTHFKNNAENCKQSHIAIIKYAKANNWPFVCIFEDDTYPCENCLELLINYLKIIPKNADLILLGWSSHRKNEKQIFDLAYNKITTWSISGTHSYIIFQSGYDDILNYFKNNPNAKADNKTFISVRNSYVIDKPLFIQYNSSKSVVNKHSGYIYYGDHTLPPIGFLPIEKLLQ
jgi:GR25 family glycosyltransferase involved in LPS biosynthesis